MNSQYINFILRLYYEILFGMGAKSFEGRIVCSFDFPFSFAYETGGVSS
jgi:hypothetical protein